MTYLVTPELPIKIGSKEYTLDGSFKTLKEIQHLLKKDIIEVLNDMTKTNFVDCAAIIRIAIDQYGTTPPNLDVIERWIVEDVGINQIRNIIQGWLLVITTPQAAREDEIKKVGEILEGGLGLRPLMEKYFFHGETTKS